MQHNKIKVVTYYLDSLSNFSMFHMFISAPFLPH